MPEQTNRLHVTGRRLVGLCGMALAAVPFLVWLQAIQTPLVYLTMPLPAGQLSYVLSKLVALYAMLALTLQILLMALRRLPGLRLGAWLPRIPLRWHAVLGISTFALIVLHGGLFVLATTLRAGHPTLDLLVPIPGEGYYATGLFVGVLGLWLCALVVLAGLARQRTRSRWPGLLHRSAWLVAILGLAHSLLIGTESRTLLETLFYAALGLALTLLLVDALRAPRPAREKITA